MKGAPRKDKEVAVIEQEVSPIVRKAEALVIEDAKGMEKAATMLTELNVANDKIEDEKEKIIAPAKLIVKTETARWKPLQTILEQGIDLVRGKMSKYQTEMVKRAREEEARIAARVGEGKGKLKVETAVSKIEEIDRAEKKVVVDEGSVTFKEQKILHILNTLEIPQKFWIVDEVAVLNALKSGETVPGAEIEIIQVPVNRR